MLIGDGSGEIIVITIPINIFAFDLRIFELTSVLDADVVNSPLIPIATGMSFLAPSKLGAVCG